MAAGKSATMCAVSVARQAAQVPPHSLFCVINPQFHGIFDGWGRKRASALRPDTDMAWWRRGDATEVQLRRPSVQLGGQASILALCANARDAVARCLSARELRSLRRSAFDPKRTLASVSEADTHQHQRTGSQEQDHA